MPQLSFFASSLAWNFGLGIVWLALPLYAHAQGLSHSQIGILFAVPILLQVPLNVAGGAYIDRIGGRRVFLISSCALAASSAWLISAHGFWELVLGQMGLVVSRAAFWPASWAMASELPGQRSVQMGRLNAISNFGQLTGTACCGFILSAGGFRQAFTVLAVLGVLAFAIGLGSAVRARRPGPVRRLWDGYARLLRNRMILYSILCAFASSLPFSMSISFFPLLLTQFGFGEASTGILLSLRGAGSIAAGLLIARFFRPGGTLWPVGCTLAMAAAVGLLPLANHAVPIGLWMFLAGVASGMMILYFQLTMSEASAPEDRGSALALGSLGWTATHFTTPLLTGLLADRWGIEAGFYVIGALILGCAAAIALLSGWAFERSSSPSSAA
jgi:MFS family permease